MSRRDLLQSHRGFRVAVLLLLATAMLMASSAEAQKEEHVHPEDGQVAPQQERCVAMADKHKAMMEMMSSMQSRLDEGAAKLDSLSGEARVEALAGLVKEMIVQRGSMMQTMMKQHSEMMSHMMEHMSGSMMGGDKKGMMEMCPMMKEMMSQGDASEAEGAHSDHHPQ